MYFQQLTKDEWDGFGYVDMGLDGFAVTPPDGVVWSEEERKTKAISLRDKERRRTRTHIAQAFLDGDLQAKLVTLSTDRSEKVEVLVLGSSSDIAEIPVDWFVTMERLSLGERYDTTYAWMTLKNEAPLFVLRASDENAEKRLKAFLADAIRFIKREEESAAA
jgi:hypothetical protein